MFTLALSPVPIQTPIRQVLEFDHPLLVLLCLVSSSFQFGREACYVLLNILVKTPFPFGFNCAMFSLATSF